MSTISPPRKASPSDVSDDGWEFVAPYLALMALDALQRSTIYARSSTRSAGWRTRGHRGATCPATSRPGPPSISRRAAGWRLAALRPWCTTYACSRACSTATAPSPPPPPGRARAAIEPQERGAGGLQRATAGYSRHKRRKGYKVHAAVDALGHLLALVVSLASDDERTHVSAPTQEVQQVTGEHVEVAFVDQCDTGDAPAAAEHGIRLEVVKLPEAKRGFVLLLRVQGTAEVARCSYARSRNAQTMLRVAATVTDFNLNSQRNPLVDNSGQAEYLVEGDIMSPQDRDS